METEEISRRLIRGITGKCAVMWSGGKSSTVLWDIAHSELESAVPVFIDHGQHPPETHDLLHWMFRKGGFNPDILRNDEVLKKIHDGLVGEYPYDMHDFRVRKLLYDDVYAQVLGSYPVVLTGERMARKKENQYLNYVDFVGKAIVIRPLLHWTEIDIWNYIKHNQAKPNKRYMMGYRVVDYVTDIKSGSMPAWMYEKEYDQEEEALNKIRDEVNGIGSE
jgi:3'-phosphoadenosine 5'-phosphosulfate sulfotransferase (PAPS reductase)/FAD synthetase